MASCRLKPMLIVINCADEGTPPDVAYGHQHSAVVPLRGRLEREIAELSPEDAPMFMEEYGITELSRSKVIRLSYDLLGVQSFLHRGRRRSARVDHSARRDGSRCGGCHSTDLARASFAPK